MTDCLENRRFVKYYYTHSISKSGKNTHIGRAYAHTNGAIDCTEESKMKSLFVGMALGVIAGMALSEVPQVKDMLGKGKKKGIEAKLALYTKIVAVIMFVLSLALVLIQKFAA